MTRQLDRAFERGENGRKYWEGENPNRVLTGWRPKWTKSSDPAYRKSIWPQAKVDRRAARASGSAEA